MSLRCWVEVDLEAIRHNVRLLKSLAGDALFMAVVKADGYGHGSVAVATACLECGASRLAVAAIGEAIVLRDAGIACPILVLGYTDPSRYPEAVRRGIDLTLTGGDDARLLARAARGEGRVARGHVKVDTGMGRLGVSPDERGARTFMEACQIEGLLVEGAYTQFAVADDPNSPYTMEQLQEYHCFLRYLETAGVFPMRHAANTAALLNFPQTRLDMVRVGIGLYGLYPAGYPQGEVALRPAMTWKADVAQVKRVPAGSTLGYGRTYRTIDETDVTTLTVGYADGYTHRLSGKAEVILGGRRVPVAGRICMDQMMVLPETPVEPGDTAVLMGEAEGVSISCEELASWSGTINYEIVCGVSVRVPRVYLGRGDKETREAESEVAIDEDR